MIITAKRGLEGLAVRRTRIHSGRVTGSRRRGKTYRFGTAGFRQITARVPGADDQGTACRSVGVQIPPRVRAIPDVAGSVHGRWFGERGGTFEAGEAAAPEVATAELVAVASSIALHRR